MATIERRTMQSSAVHLPARLDGENVITRCLDCRTAGCPAQARSQWPATTIPADCELPRLEYEDADEDA